ncbi:hypothetical protein [Ammoniphilus sp. YIM 78166]|uniref:hypothetical protein n=1 Tax=Ammoniphilus sp. YIM 78166 TaxID=1644106 RepID=UPI00106F6469|nr:hypothetical protein [Ammoniphilus sp. YIM 78166]
MHTQPLPNKPIIRDYIIICSADEFGCGIGVGVAARWVEGGPVGLAKRTPDPAKLTIGPAISTPRPANPALAVHATARPGPQSGEKTA